MKSPRCRRSFWCSRCQLPSGTRWPTYGHQVEPTPTHPTSHRFDISQINFLPLFVSRNGELGPVCLRKRDANSSGSPAILLGSNAPPQLFHQSQHLPSSSARPSATLHTSIAVRKASSQSCNQWTRSASKARSTVRDLVSSSVANRPVWLLRKEEDEYRGRVHFALLFLAIGSTCNEVLHHLYSNFAAPTARHTWTHPPHSSSWLDSYRKRSNPAHKPSSRLHTYPTVWEKPIHGRRVLSSKLCIIWASTMWGNECFQTDLDYAHPPCLRSHLVPHWVNANDMHLLLGRSDYRWSNEKPPFAPLFVWEFTWITSINFI